MLGAGTSNGLFDCDTVSFPRPHYKQQGGVEGTLHTQSGAAVCLRVSIHSSTLRFLFSSPPFPWQLSWGQLRGSHRVSGGFTRTALGLDSA